MLAVQGIATKGRAPAGPVVKWPGGKGRQLGQLRPLLAGDFVYLDPPYLPRDGRGFVAYGPGGFALEDHQRLRQVCDELTRKGCFVMLSSSDVPAIGELYAGWQVDRVLAPRAINRRGDGRGKVLELVVRNYGRCADG